jgi:ribosomal protein S27AE
MSSNKNKPDMKNFPCPVCGGKEFIIGHLTSPPHGVFFEPEKGMWARARSRLAGNMGDILAARKCIHCGNILIFAEQDN